MEDTAIILIAVFSILGGLGLVICWSICVIRKRDRARQPQQALSLRITNWNGARGSVTAAGTGGMRSHFFKGASPATTLYARPPSSVVVRDDFGRVLSPMPGSPLALPPSARGGPPVPGNFRLAPTLTHPGSPTRGGVPRRPETSVIDRNPSTEMVRITHKAGTTSIDPEEEDVEGGALPPGYSTDAATQQRAAASTGLTRDARPPHRR